MCFQRAPLWLLAGSFPHSPLGPLSPYGCSQHGFLKSEWSSRRMEATVSEEWYCCFSCSLLVVHVSSGRCGRLLCGGVTPKRGRLPATVHPPACRAPVLSLNPHIQCAHHFPRPSHVSFYDGIILKSRTTSSKAGPGIGGVPWRSLLQHSFLSSLISTCLCSPICPTSQNTVEGQAQGNFCRHSCFLRGKMGDAKASLAHSVSEVQMGSVDRAQAWELLSKFTSLPSVLLVLPLFFFFSIKYSRCL